MCIWQFEVALESFFPRQFKGWFCIFSIGGFSRRVGLVNCCADFSSNFAGDVRRSIPNWFGQVVSIKRKQGFTSGRCPSRPLHNTITRARPMGFQASPRSPARLQLSCLCDNMRHGDSPLSHHRDMHVWHLNDLLNQPRPRFYFILCSLTLSEVSASRKFEHHPRGPKRTPTELARSCPTHELCSFSCDEERAP